MKVIYPGLEGYHHPDLPIGGAGAGQPESEQENLSDQIFQATVDLLRDKGQGVSVLAAGISKEDGKQVWIVTVLDQDINRFNDYRAEIEAALCEQFGQTVVLERASAVFEAQDGLR